MKREQAETAVRILLRSLPEIEKAVGPELMCSIRSAVLDLNGYVVRKRREVAPEPVDERARRWKRMREEAITGRPRPRLMLPGIPAEAAV